MARKRLGEILVQAGVLSERSLQAALNEQRRWGGPIGGILVEMGLVPEETMVQALSRQLNLPMARLDDRDIGREILDLVGGELAEQHRLIPFNLEGKFLDVAMSDPTNLGIIDELRIRTQLNVRPYLAGPHAIDKALHRLYGRGGPDFSYRLGNRPDDMQRLPANIEVIELGARGAERHAPSPEVTNDDPSTYPSGMPSISYGQPASRDAEIEALQSRLQHLEALVARDEDVLRKVLALLVEKGVATREEILERIK
jgi:hypothetical protein